MMGQLLGGQQLLFYSFNLEDHVPALRSRPSAGAEQFRPHGAIRHLQHFGMRISQGSTSICGARSLFSLSRCKVSAGTIFDKFWRELEIGDIAFQMPAICQVFRRTLGEVGIDVLRCLLSADTEALHQLPLG